MRKIIHIIRIESTSFKSTEKSDEGEDISIKGKGMLN